MIEKKKKAIEHLNEYIRTDVYFNKKEKVESDFDKFCYNHCNDIFVLLEIVNDLETKNKWLEKEYCKLQKRETETETELEICKFEKHMQIIKFNDLQKQLKEKDL